MGITYRIDKARGITVVLWDKLVTSEQFLAHVRTLLADAEWPPQQRLHLCDLRQASIDASIDEACLKSAADLYGTKREKISTMKVAIVAGEAFAKSKQFERFMSPYSATVIVFNNIETACAWLGVDVTHTKRKLDELRALPHGGASL